MSSKRKMTEEEDERSKDNFWKKFTRYKPAKRKQKFKIYYTEFLTAANRDRRKKTSATLELNEDTSEEEIRNSLISELSQLKDQNFRFFTKDKEGTLYYCPCKPKCNEDHFKAEWNASNIAKVVKEDRPVHIFIEGVSELDESSSGYGTTVSQDNHRSPDPLEVEVRNAGSLVDYLTNEEPPPPLEIKEIVPEEGKVEGGYTFHLELKEYCTDVFKVQFGETDPIDVDRFDKVIYKGKVPASSNAGVVEVKIVQTSANVKNTIPFTYTDKDLEKKPDIDEQLKSMDEAQLEDLLIATAKQFSRINLKSNEEKTRHSDSGGGKNHSLPLLRMIADTAARINSIAFFEILFRTHAGCTLFKSFKDSQPPLEEIARLNGHLELAWMLEKKHLMFRDDESDSDDEVDWEAISKTIGKYQAKYDESVEKLSLQSIDSSRSVHGYLADRENSSSLSSLHVSIGETYNKESKMGGDHKFLEEKMKLIVRPYSEPVLSSIYDKVGRKWTTFSYDEVGSLRKKLTSCSTKHIDDNEAFCSLLSVDDLDAHLKRMKITAERKSSLKKSERKELQKLPDHHNFYNSRCHLDAFCSLKNSHIADTPSCHEEEDPLEKEEMLSCVRVNGLSTGSSSTDSSSPLNNRRRKPYFVWRCCQVTLILSVVTIMAFVTLFAVQAFYKTSVTLKSTGPCNATQNLVKYEDGSLSCKECPLCPPGLGLSAECGSSTPLSASISMKCIPCPLGVSFSSDYDSSICTPCSSCADSEKVQRNCSRTRDTKCAINCSEKDSHNKCITSTAVTPSSATTGNSLREDLTSKTALQLPLIGLASLTALLTMVVLLQFMILCWGKLQEVAIRKRAVVIARAKGRDRPDFGSSGGAKDKKERTQIFVDRESRRPLSEETM